MEKNCREIEILDHALLEMATECLRTIAHPCRLRVISILLQQTCTVGELAKYCDIPSNMASEHLRLLKDRGLLTNRREGRRVYYSVAEPALANIIECVRDWGGGRDWGTEPKTPVKAALELEV